MKRIRHENVGFHGGIRSVGQIERAAAMRCEPCAGATKDPPSIDSAPSIPINHHAKLVRTAALQGFLRQRTHFRGHGEGDDNL